VSSPLFFKPPGSCTHGDKAQVFPFHEAVHEASWICEERGAEAPSCQAFCIARCEARIGRAQIRGEEAPPGSGEAKESIGKKESTSQEARIGEEGRSLTGHARRACGDVGRE
jgi:hypothetical protein